MAFNDGLSSSKGVTVITGAPIEVNPLGSIKKTTVKKPALDSNFSLGGTIDGPLERATLKPDSNLEFKSGLADDTKQPIGELSTKYKSSMIALAGANFMMEVMNAGNAYTAAKGQAQLNILQARNQGADALYRGRQAQMDAQSEGRNNGDQAKLAMVAQGQDANGAGVQKVVGSYEAMGEYNGMREEINFIREALGLELEEINYDYQVKNAKTARDNAMIGSALNFGASAAKFGSK